MLPTSAGVEPVTSWSSVGQRIQLSHRGRPGPAVLEKKTFKDYEILYMYIAQGQGQITKRDKIFIVTERASYFDHTL